MRIDYQVIAGNFSKLHDDASWGILGTHSEFYVVVAEEEFFESKKNHKYLH